MNPSLDYKSLSQKFHAPKKKRKQGEKDEARYNSGRVNKLLARGIPATCNLNLNASRRERRAMTAIRSKTFASDNVLCAIFLHQRDSHFVPARVFPSGLLDCASRHLSLRKHTHTHTHIFSLCLSQRFSFSFLSLRSSLSHRFVSVSTTIFIRLSRSSRVLLSPFCRVSCLLFSHLSRRYAPSLSVTSLHLLRLSFLIPLCCVSCLSLPPKSTGLFLLLVQSALVTLSPWTHSETPTTRAVLVSVPRFCFKLRRLADCETTSGNFCADVACTVCLMRTWTSFL